MVATGSDPARSRATAVDHSGADFLFPPDTSARPALPPPGAESPEPEPVRDWAAETADAIERLVGSIRTKTSGPLEALARILVYGLVALIVGLAAAVLGAVALVRALDLALPGDVWLAHGLTGGIFALAGLFLWRKRTVKTVKV
jgi:hypothetical protein